jgi:hypothetical protein
LFAQAFALEAISQMGGAAWLLISVVAITLAGQEPARVPCAKLIKFMDELINLVVQRTGISQDDARKAVEVIVNALKSRLPGPLASHIDSFISGGMSGGVSTLEAEAGEMLKGKLGGLFGGSKT